MSSLDDPSVLLAVAAQSLHANGCDSNVGGQISMRSHDGRGFYAVGFKRFGRCRPSDVALIDWDLETVEGEFAMAKALRAHAAIYQTRVDVNAVIHTHSHNAVVFSSTQVPLGMFDITAVLFHGEQALHVDDGTNEHVAVVESLGDKRVVFVKNHGVVLASERIETAVVEAIAVERCAGIHLACVAAGGSEISNLEIEAGRATYRPGYLRLMWDDCVEHLQSTKPELFEP